IPGWIKAPLGRVPWIFEVRDLWPESAVTAGVVSARSPLTRFLYWLERASCRRAARVVALTQAIADDIVRRGLAPASRLAVIPNAADLRLFAPASRDNAFRREQGFGERIVAMYTGAHGRPRDRRRGARARVRRGEGRPLRRTRRWARDREDDPRACGRRGAPSAPRRERSDLGPGTRVTGAPCRTLPRDAGGVGDAAVTRSSVCVVGLGYVGLPTASMLATRGFDVYGLDTNERVVRELSAGRTHISERDLDTLVQAAVQSGKLRCGTTAEPADVFVVAVPTPVQEDRTADLTSVRSAATSIARVL